MAGVALVGEWERSVCAVSERVEQKIRAKKEGKREKGKDDRCGIAFGNTWVRPRKIVGQNPRPNWWVGGFT